MCEVFLCDDNNLMIFFNNWRTVKYNEITTSKKIQNSFCEQLFHKKIKLYIHSFDNLWMLSEIKKR